MIIKIKIKKIITILHPLECNCKLQVKQCEKVHANVHYSVIIIILLLSKLSKKLLILSTPPVPPPKVLKTAKTSNSEKVFLNPRNFHVYNLS